ncbi:hypothetical protein K469DRAFT_64811 [Zopfia rhizophila CBS 207.26]|uniref:Uncharacterized protein n=1 Tax=Zopfia rhizophila CBS 207.26 TaxID=1314779 RepID=A0A6A6DB69_9PEZI|nr:hypothetical protein K469DRAFT_64811 [Zopfia rhizophila CBS 207.26]
MNELTLNYRSSVELITTVERSTFCAGHIERQAVPSVAYSSNQHGFRYSLSFHDSGNDVLLPQFQRQVFMVLLAMVLSVPVATRTAMIILLQSRP